MCKEVSDLANPYQVQEEAHVAPLTFSLLIASPIHRRVPFAPVSAALFPLGRVKLPYAGLLIAGLDFFISFLIKRSLVIPPHFSRYSLQSQSPTLTMEELWRMLYYQGQGSQNQDFRNNTNSVSPASPQGFFPQSRTSLFGGQSGQSPNSPAGEDEPLFPENLAFSLSISGSLYGISGTPDTSFNVPLFELPGTPGNLIISFITLLAQLFIELSPLPSNNSSGG